MSDLIVCTGNPSKWARSVIRCPYCRTKTRFLTRLVFGGYSSDAVCGRCGAWGGDGEMRRCGKRESAENRELVRREWPRAWTRDQQMAWLMEQAA